ncbi:MAG: ThuA domain-containing protein [Planctomycetes bacterium]|nr:ThuA domain-containing protein [Planctomycetota bacterium]
MSAPSHRSAASFPLALVPIVLVLIALVGVGTAVLAQERPSSAARRLSVLFFGAPTANGPHHDPITRYATLKRAFGTEGIDLTYVEDPAIAFRSETLRAHDALLMYGNWHQTGRMPTAQLRALLDWVESGGGFVAVHCASACYGATPEFRRLVGARFQSHGGEEFQVEDRLPGHPILSGAGAYTAWDETYVHDEHGNDREILQTRQGEPWSWTRRQGEGRVFYTASGHDHRVWDLPQFQRLLRNAVYWCVGPERKAQLDAFGLPVLEDEPVSLPGYRERREITRAQKPLSPEQSLKLAQVPVGMELALFAAEPDIVNPIAIAFDPRGRAFVVETVDYPNELQAGNLGHDRITICEDTDGDGRADRFTRFAERLSIPTSLVFANGGVICTNGSELLFLADRDGDDRAEVREVLVTGFHMGDTHAGISNLRYGFDGWIWATIGYSGFAGEVGGVRHEFAQGLLRFRPDASALEFRQHTTNNTWGLGFTESFDVVGSTANGNPSWYASVPDARLRQAGLEPAPTPRADDNPRFFPMSTDIRQVDQFDRYTSAAGHALYTARRFPPEYHDRIAFVCEPTGKLVGEFEMRREGAGFKAAQRPNNLYASADAWSSPVWAEPGPDGAVWICDWYSIVVQHNPTPSRASAGVDARTGRGNAYETPLRDQRFGRIYRVYPTGSADEPAPTLDPATPATLLAGLSHGNLLVRLHAQRLLVETSVAGTQELAELVLADGPGAPHALEVLAARGALDDAVIARALRAPREATRRRAIAHADPSQLRAAMLIDGTLRATGKELAEVLLGLAAAALDPELGTALLELAAREDGALFRDRTLREAWQVAARAQAPMVLAAAASLRGEAPTPPAPVNLLPDPGFETEREGRVPAWSDLRTYGGARGDAIAVGSHAPGRSGDRCLRVHCDAMTDSGLAATIKVQRGTRYRLSGFVRTVDLVPARGAPGAMLNVPGGARTRGVHGTTEWTELSVEFDSGDADEIVVHCLYGGYGGAKGTAFFDDVALVAIGSGVSLTGVLESLAAYAAERGRPAATAPERRFEPDADVHARGNAVYARTCIACHGVDGRGVPGVFPPLDGSDWLSGDPELPIRIVLHGLQGPIVVGDAHFDSAMAPLGPALSDAEIADVLTLVRQRWSNDAAPVDAATVSRVRDATRARTSPWSPKELGR